MRILRNCTQCENMRVIIGFCILIFLTGCNKSSGRIPTRILVGLNDSAIYHIDKDGHTRAVEKKQYYKPSQFLIILRADTVELGKEFYASFHVYRKTFEIEIAEPKMDLIKFYEQKESFKGVGYGFHYKTQREGIFTFKGEIRYDSIVSPFEWKFIVVPIE